MNIEKKLNRIFDNLPTGLTKNISFIEITKLVKKLVKNSGEVKDLVIELNKEVFDKELFTEDIIPFTNELHILSISTDLMSFNLSKKGTYEIYFNTYEILKNLTKVVEIKIVFDNTTTWSVTEYLCDNLDYFYSYETNFYNYSSDGEILEVENIEEKKDEDFSVIWGIPLEKTRYYRLNFKANLEYLNQMKSLKRMAILDDLYRSEKVLFTIPFKMNNFESFLLSEYIEEDDERNFDREVDDYEDYNNDSEEEQEEMDIKAELIEKARELKQKITSQTGEEGEFVMSTNLHLNLANYLADENEAINTYGIIIKKNDNIYTLYYTNINNNNLTMIKKIGKKEELKEMYENHEFNKYMVGLEEFFGFDKGLKLEPND